MPVKRFLSILLMVVITGTSAVVRAQEPEGEPVDTTWYVPGDLNYNLIIAAYLGLNDDVLRFLNQGAYINTTTMSGNSPLLYASGEGYLSTVQLLVLNGADIHEENIEGIFPLFQAVLKNHIDVAEYLISRGANVNRRDNLGRTPLLVASAYNYVAMADLLIQNGADVNLSDKQGTSPLMAAVYAGNIGLAGLLKDSGANPDLTDKKGYTPLMVATQMQDTAFVRFLLSAGADPFATDPSGHSVLTIAVGNHDTLLARYFLDLDTAGLFRAKENINPMEFARRNNDPVMRSLLETYGYQRNFSLYFSDVSAGGLILFNTRDLFTGFEAGITEGYTGIQFAAGFMFRPSPVRIHQQLRENYYVQYWEKRNIFYGTLRRDFLFFGKNRSARGGAILGIGGGYSFGPAWNGSQAKPESLFFINPEAGIFYSQMFWKVNLTYHYQNLNTLRIYPHYISFGINFTFQLKSVSSPRKTISWY